MIRIGKYIYDWCETGDWIICGEVVNGRDCDFIKWYK